MLKNNAKSYKTITKSATKEVTRLICPVYINPEIRPITYPGIKQNFYQIMEFGPVFEIATGKEIKPFLNTYRYYQIKLLDVNDNLCFPLVSRLVAYEFCLENRDLSLQVDHVDGITINNDYRNLEWVTLQENLKRKYIRRRTIYPYYKTEEQIYNLCEILANTSIKYLDACRIVGMNIGYNQAKALCCDLIEKKYWKDIANQFDFTQRKMLWPEILTDEQKQHLLNLYLQGLDIPTIYKLFYNKEWDSTDRKERDRFRHVMSRITSKLTDHPRGRSREKV